MFNDRVHYYDIIEVKKSKNLDEPNTETVVETIKEDVHLAAKRVKEWQKSDKNEGWMTGFEPYMYYVKIRQVREENKVKKLMSEYFAKGSVYGNTAIEKAISAMVEDGRIKISE